LRHQAQASHIALSSSSAKADEPVFRAVFVQLGVTADRLLAFARVTIQA
jgi:hypothetical protein